MVACLIFSGAHSNYFKFVLNFHHAIGIPIKKQFNDFYSFLHIINFLIIEFQTFVIYAPACEKIKEKNIRKKYLYFNKIRL